MTEPNLRILMADDHPILLAGLAALVKDEPGMTIVGEARDGRSAQMLGDELRPDVIVLDLSMPEMDGAEAAIGLLAARPECRILVLTVHEDRASLRRMLDLGVAGYLIKRSAAGELVRAIRAVAAGGIYLDPAIAAKAVGIAEPGPAKPADPEAPALSEREAAVLRLIANGHSNKEVSARLAISVKTVETYKARAMEKLGFRTRVDVVRHAASKGWLGG